VRLLGIAGSTVVLLFLTVKVILPLAVMHILGVGVEIPVPARFAKAHPAITMYGFNIGGPLLFLATLACLTWLLWPRAAAR
jgi:hypothetical protein